MFVSLKSLSADYSQVEQTTGGVATLPSGGLTGTVENPALTWTMTCSMCTTSVIFIETLIVHGYMHKK